jgi:hypothetical protein
MLGSLLSISLGTYLRVELLEHMVILFNFLRNCQTIFHTNKEIMMQFFYDAILLSRLQTMVTFL